MKLTRTYPLLAVALLALFSACSTEKAKWTNVQFHNTTCHYNVWWNGNESLKAGVEKLKKAAVDDYTAFLPPEYLGTADAARSIRSRTEMFCVFNVLSSIRLIRSVVNIFI